MINTLKNMTIFNFKDFQNNALSIGILLFVFIRVFVWIQFDFSYSLFNCQEGQCGDSYYYIDVARNIFNLGTHVTHVEGPTDNYSYRAPLYSYFLAGLLQLNIEINALNIYIINSLILFSSYLISYLLIKDINPRVSSVIFILLCLSPFDAVYNGRVLSENLLSPLLLLSLVLLLFFHKRAFYGYILPGIFLGFTALTKDIFLLLPFFIVVFMLIQKSQLKYIALFFLSYCCVISPWVVRNATLPSDSFVGVSKGIMWTNLWVGTWLRDDLSLSSADQLELFNEKSENRLFEQSFFRIQTIDNLTNKTFQVIGNWMYRIPKMWVGTRTDLFKMKFDSSSISWYLSKLSFFALNSVVLILVIPLLVFGLMRKDRASFLVSIFTLYLLLIYMPFYNLETRYSQPVLGIIIFYIGFSEKIFKGFLRNIGLLFKRNRK